MTAISDSSAYHEWFCAKVREALEDTRPDIDDAEVEFYFSERRAEALRKAKSENR